MNTIKLQDFPADAVHGQVYEIIPDKSKVVSSTNRLFNKYPTRYISAVPRYAIKNFSDIGDTILDPFCGSGTTAIEAMLLGRNALSVDIDPFARLLISVKTEEYKIEDLKLIDRVVNGLKTAKSSDLKRHWVPKIQNIEKWFCETSIVQLSFIKWFIDKSCENNGRVKNYLYVVLAGIIRKCSNADEVSPKPYISTRYPKIPEIPMEIFFKYEEMYRKAIIEYSEVVSKFNNTSKVLESNDARIINVKSNIDAAITSPPYINAYDYVRSLKFEDMWLGLATDSELRNNRKSYIGTESVGSFYNEFIYANQSEILHPIVSEIYAVDAKRAKMVNTYFEDMSKNLMAVKEALKPGGYYTIVVGDSNIRGQVIPTAKILQEIAEKNGYTYQIGFKYLIRDRYLHLPRGNRGGIIKYDEILVLRKK